MPADLPQKITLEVVLGFSLGMLLSAGILIFSLLLGSALGFRQKWMIPTLSGVMLLAAGGFALRKVRTSRLAQGVLAAVTLAFVVNGFCGTMISSLR